MMTMSTTRFRRATLFSIVLMAATATKADDLGVLSSVLATNSLYLSGNLGSSALNGYSNTDTYLGIVVGGNAYLGSTNPSLGGIDINSSKSSPSYSTVVGGTLYASNGTINGNVYSTGIVFDSQNSGFTVKGSVTGGTVVVNGTSGGTITGGLTTGSTTAPKGITVDGTTTTSAATASPFDIGSTFSQLAAASTTLANGGKSTKGTTVSDEYGTLTLTGTDKKLDIFQVSSSDFTSFTSSYSLNAPAGATVIVDVTGTSPVTIQYAGMKVNGTSASNVLYNFENTSSISINGVGFLGSILAPSATITGSNGQLDGSVVAASYVGSLEIDKGAFQGSVSAVPLPPAALLFGSAMLGLGGLGLRRRRYNRVS